MCLQTPAPSLESGPETGALWGLKVPFEFPSQEPWHLHQTELKEINTTGAGNRRTINADQIMLDSYYKEEVYLFAVP